MPGSSNLGFWNYIDDDWLEPDYPVSTGHAWTLRDNLAHLIDSQCQVRVSWMGQSSRDDHVQLYSSTNAGFYVVEFPITILADGYLPGLRVNEWIYSANATNTLTVVANLRWATEPFFSTGTTADSQALWSFTNTTTSTTGQKKTNYYTTAKRTGGVSNGSRLYSIEENSDDHVTEIRMARLEIAMTDDNGYGGGVVGLQVVEFPLWP